MSDLELAKARQRQARAKTEKSFGQIVWENIFGDNDPNSHNFGEKVGAALNKAGEAMTFGLIGDEASAAVADIIPGGMDYDERLAHERKQEEVLERDNPGLALTSEIGGGVLGAFLPGGQIGTLAKGSGLGARIVASGAAGAGMGGVYGFMEGEGLQDRLDQGGDGATMGAGVGAFAPIAGAGAQKVADRIALGKAIRAAMRSSPTAADQKAASGAAYDLFENAGVELTPDAMARLAARLEARMAKEGIGVIPGASSLTPGAKQVVSSSSDMAHQVARAAAAGQNPAVPLTSIEQLRRVAGSVAQDVNPVGRATQDGRLGAIAVDEIDAFIGGLKGADVAIGDADVARSALIRARDLWKRATKTQLLEDVLEQQDNYLGGPASAIRNRVAALLRNPKTRKQFTSAEQAVLRRIIGGSGLTRAIRLAGNGIGRQIQMMGGGALGGLPGLLAGAVTGELTGGIADKNAIRMATAARDAVASGRMPTALPQGDATRRLTEALARRVGAAVPH